MRVGHVICEGLLRFRGSRRMNLVWRVNAFGPPLGLDFRPQAGKKVVQGRHGLSELIGVEILFLFRGSAEQLLEKRSIFLLASVVVRPDVLEIRSIGQRILGDEVNIAPIKAWISPALGRDEAFTKN